MKIKCPKCKTEYRVDDAKIPDKGAYSRCKKCQTRFVVKKEIKPKEKTRPVVRVDCAECGFTQVPSESCKHCGARLPKKTIGIPETKVEKEKAKPPEEKEPLEKKETVAEAPEKEVKKESEISSQEELVDQYVQQGDQETAARLLLDIITKSAKEKNFSKAEEFRDKLYEVAPMALNEIVRAGEIIEEEKTQAMDQDHLRTWSDLYDSLSPDEANAVYFAMKTITFKAGQPVFKQGQFDSRLYFIQKGRLNMLYFDRSGQQEVVLKELTPGDIVNDDAFFSFTVCTTSLVAVSEAELTFLEKDILDKWEKEFPGIQNKLNNFCRSFERVSDLIEKSGAGFRAHKRVKTPINAIVQLIDKSGKPFKTPFKVSLFDISAGGTSYGFKLSKKEEASQLLEHSLNIQTIYQDSTGKKKISCNGKIVAIHLQPFDDSSVHVQFENLLDEKIVTDIAHMTFSPG